MSGKVIVKVAVAKAEKKALDLRMWLSSRNKVKKH